MQILTFYSDKGGVGKTLFNVSMGAYLLYKQQKRVCIIDTVSGSRCLTDDRQFEVKNILSNEVLQDQYTTDEIIDMKDNPLLGCPLHIYKLERFDDFINFIKENKNKYDYALLDSTGMTETNIKILVKAKYMFFITTLEDYKRDLFTYNTFKHVTKTKKFMIENIFMLFNKVDKINEIYTKISNIKNNNQVTFLDTIFYNRHSAIEMFSTIKGMHTELNDVAFDLEELFKEVFVKIETEQLTY